MSTKAPLFLIIIFLMVLGLLIFNFRRIEKVEALADGQNTWGWAWAERIGWISFNNTNTGGAVDYGVNIDQATGKLSGYAWSRGTDTDVGGIGWIMFNPPGPYPVSPNYSACLDLPGSGQDCDGVGDWTVSGWARACAGAPDPDTCGGGVGPNSNSGGWDGWIKLRGTVPSYGVYLVSTGLANEYEFRGWAWGGGGTSFENAIVGWISFNSRNCDVNGNYLYEGVAEGAPSDCPISGIAYPYRILTSVNFPPTAINLLVDSYSNTVCGLTSGARIRLKWDFLDPGDIQTAYQIQIDDNSNFASPEIDTLKVNSSSQEFVNDPPAYPLLEWGKTYYWRLMVWDSQGTSSSDWITYPGSFTTPTHSYPDPDFTPSPPRPLTHQPVTFYDLSACYYWDGPYHTAYPCKDLNPNNSAYNRYQWDYEYDTGIDCDSNIDPACRGNVTTTYTTEGRRQVLLMVTDEIGTCSIIREVPIIFPPPEWKEIPPF